jgi:hypothetical protein
MFLAFFTLRRAFLSHMPTQAKRPMRSRGCAFAFWLNALLDGPCLFEAGFVTTDLGGL